MTAQKQYIRYGVLYYVYLGISLLHCLPEMDYTFMQSSPSYQDLAKMRKRHHAQDLLESKSLLLELGCSEPTLQLCFKIIESTCLY